MVNDSVIFLSPYNVDLVKSVMEERELLTSFGVRLRIPIPVSISTGKKWGHMVPVQQDDSKC